MVVQSGHDWDRDYGAGPLNCPTRRIVTALTVPSLNRADYGESTPGSA